MGRMFGLRRGFGEVHRPLWPSASELAIGDSRLVGIGARGMGQ